MKKFENSLMIFNNLKSKWQRISDFIIIIIIILQNNFSQENQWQLK
jgi:hypothetical protein